MSVGAFTGKTELGSRPRSLGTHAISRVERAELQVLTTSLAKGRHYAHRPRTWGACQETIAGPCPWVSCRHHLLLEVDEESGSVRINHPGKQVDELEETCALRVAEQGGHTLERTGQLVNISLERTRQVEEVALASYKRRLLSDDKTNPAERAARRRIANAMDARARARCEPAAADEAAR